MVENKLHIILHGHFYQPPREDPWIGEIIKQSSAAPFHDWNERINKQCYAANAASRVLDNRGRIVSIINNYKYLSFNFGPTLIDWLAKHDPYTLNKIIQADRASIDLNNGHGNAIAQVYNHIIMPLASDADKITQIEWGLRHFEKYFGRKSEGMWLAETAVNNRVAEFLIDYGIKYIILAPTQANEVQAMHTDDDTWHDVSNNNIDPSVPYMLREQNGEIAVFFYYGNIAAKLSFQHLLQHSDYLRGELLAHNNPEKENHLVHTATDGEVYGHHEPYGDMCLSRVIYDNEEKKDFIFTNYANFLEQNPPLYYARLKEGNDSLGTAWSCAHGVDRWRRDCGCSTGAQAGWNQKWREHLRYAFDFLRDELHKHAEKALDKYIVNVWQARNDYINIVMTTNINERQTAIDLFFKQHAKIELVGYTRTFVLMIMEALHNELLMYTSCGWFFAEISGIETVQDMEYAARLLKLAADILPNDTADKFKNILRKAKSNIDEWQNGKWIYVNFVEKHVFDEEHIINQFLMNSLLTEDKLQIDSSIDYYYYSITVSNRQTIKKDDLTINKFQLNLKNNLFEANEDYVAYIFRNEHDFSTFIKNIVDSSLIEYLDKIIEKDNSKTMIKHFNDWFLKSYSLIDIKYDCKERILIKMFEKTLSTLHKKNLFDEIQMAKYLQIIDLYRELEVSLLPKDMVAIKELINSYILSELATIKEVGIEKYEFTELIQTIQTVKRANIDIDYQEITPIISDFVDSRMVKAIVELDAHELYLLERIIDFANVSGIDFEKYAIQNLLYDTLTKYTNRNDRNLHQETEKRLLRLADKFNICTVYFERVIKTSWT